MSDVIICGLCYEELCFAVNEFEKIKEYVVLQSCGHCYHKTCITAAHAAEREASYSITTTCPLCKTPTTPRSITKAQTAASAYTRLFLTTEAFNPSQICLSGQHPSKLCEKAASVIRIAEELKIMSVEIPRLAEEMAGWCGKGMLKGTDLERNVLEAIESEMSSKLDRALDLLQMCKAEDTLLGQYQVLSPVISLVHERLGLCMAAVARYTGQLLNEERFQAELGKRDKIVANHKASIIALERYQKRHAETLGLEALKLHNMTQQMDTLQASVTYWQECNWTSTQESAALKLKNGELASELLVMQDKKEEVERQVRDLRREARVARRTLRAGTTTFAKRDRRRSTEAAGTEASQPSGASKPSTQHPIKCGFTFTAPIATAACNKNQVPLQASQHSVKNGTSSTKAKPSLPGSSAATRPKRDIRTPASLTGCGDDYSTRLENIALRLGRLQEQVRVCTLFTDPASGISQHGADGISAALATSYARATIALPSNTSALSTTSCASPAPNEFSEEAAWTTVKRPTRARRVDQSKPSLPTKITNRSTAQQQPAPPVAPHNKAVVQDLSGASQDPGATTQAQQSSPHAGRRMPWHQSRR